MFTADEQIISSEIRLTLLISGEAQGGFSDAKTNLGLGRGKRRLTPAALVEYLSDGHRLRGGIGMGAISWRVFRPLVRNRKNWIMFQTCYNSGIQQ